MVEIVQVATGVAGALAPFLPYLVVLGKSTGKKLQEVVDEQGGEFVYNRAKNLWEKISKRYGEDKVLMNQAEIVALEPEKEAWQEAFATVLAERLSEDPDFAQELLTAMGGPERLQEVTAGKDAWIENIKQSMGGAGTQRIQAGSGAVIKDVTQDQK